MEVSQPGAEVPPLPVYGICRRLFSQHRLRPHLPHRAPGFPGLLYLQAENFRPGPGELRQPGLRPTPPRCLPPPQAAGKPVITFSQKNPQADVYAFSVRKEDGQTVFQVRTPSYEREFRLTMPGLFNVENALGVIAVCEALHIPDWAVYDGLVRGPGCPGGWRCSPNADGSVQAIVDYAHIPPVLRDPVPLGAGGVPRPEYGHRLRLPRQEGLRPPPRPGGGRRAVVRPGLPHRGGQRRGGHPGHLPGDRPQRGEGGLSPSRSSPTGGGHPPAVLDSQWPSILLLTGKGRETRQKRGIEYIDTPTDVEYGTGLPSGVRPDPPAGPRLPRQGALSVLPALEERQGGDMGGLCPAGGALRPAGRARPGPGGGPGGAGAPPGRRAAPRPVRSGVALSAGTAAS